MNSVWQATATAPAASDGLSGPIEVGVAIVGGGYTGLHAALALAEAGESVAVFEAAAIGGGASGLNGGQVNPMLPVADPGALRRAVGGRAFERVAEASLGSADALFALIARLGLDCDARQCGWLRADHSAAARDAARVVAREWNALGAGFEFVDGVDARAMIGSEAYGSGTLSRRGGAVHPLKLARGLAAAVRAAGGAVFEHTPVSALAPDAGRWSLIAGGHRVGARQLIIATNGYTDRLWPGLRASVLPITPVQVATEPLPAAQVDRVLPGGQTVSDTRRMIMYARREPDDRLVYGGIGFPRPGGVLGGFDWLIDDARRVFPHIPRAAWRFRWGGRIALTPSHVPHLHEPAPGVLIGLGYNGRGVAMSAVVGAALAARVLGAPAEQLPVPLSPVRRHAWRWPQVIGAPLAMAWWRWRDAREWGA